VGNVRTFGGVRGNLAPYLKSLSLLPNIPAQEGVSLKEFCQNPAGRFLFLSSTPSTRDLLRPIQQLILQQIVNHSCSLAPDPARRIWLVLDELPILLPSAAIQQALAEGRKFGLTVALGIQDLSQSSAVQGREETQAMMSMPKTRLILRVGDPESADMMSRMIGDRHFKRRQQTHTSNSTPGSAGGGGTSTTWSITTERAVLPIQISSLPDLEGYLLTGGGAFKVYLPYKKMDNISDHYQPVPPRRLPTPAIKEAP
ncbi:MAG: type IV secretion system DNA-binding domain-containing protein, partial [Acidobacteriaceae bacterium]